MSKFKYLAPLSISLMCFLDQGAFAQDTSMHKMNMAGTAKPAFEKHGIKLYRVEDSPDFPDAKLTMKIPEDNALLPEGKVSFQYDLSGYDLGKQTGDHHDCANSAKGQHIHLILNNEPYIALYDTKYSQELKPGGYVALSFLSRSYHESVKHKGAYSLNYFIVGDDPSKHKVDLKAPLMFYSRPKGDYKGEAETKRILLDYYLVNCDLSKKGYNVKCTIDGTEFNFTKWEPYFIEGLGMGTHTITLELQDKYGMTVENKFNPVERHINLTADDPVVK